MMRSAHAVLVAAVLALVGCSAADETPVVTPAADRGELTCVVDPWLIGSDWELARRVGSRTDVRADGNRRGAGGLDLAAAQVSSVTLGADPIWVIADPTRLRTDGARWIVALDDDRLVSIESSDGTITELDETPNGPPQFVNDLLLGAYVDHALFDDSLVDTRVVRYGDWAAALVDPTDRYRHGVLGDAVEAGGIALVNLCTGEQRRIDVGPVDVIEGISPMLIDVEFASSDERVPEILVTLSNADSGARLALFNIDGSLRAESAPIGRSNRWRNQLAVAQTTRDGGLEVIDVRTPHIGGTVEYFRIVVGDDGPDDGPGVLERVAASSARYTTHTIGSRNLDMGLVIDVDGDKVGEVVLPTSDHGTLVALDRVGDEVAPIVEIDLGGRMVTNLSSQWIDGTAYLALGTGDGRLVIIGP